MKSITRKEFDREVASGKQWIIFKHAVLDVNEWLQSHPGGRHVLLFMVGKDATDWIYGFHPPRVYETKVYQFQVAQLKNPRDPPTESRNYRDLVIKLRDEGYFEPAISYHVKEIFVLTAALVSAILTLVYKGSELAFVLLSAALFAFLWNGLGFFLHDIGHHAILCDRKLDNHIGYLLGCAINGVGMTDWIYRHNTHHAATNNLQYDPDIQLYPVWAFNTKSFDNLFSYYSGRVLEYGLAQKLLVLLQNLTFYPLLALARFRFQFLSYKRIFDPHTPKDLRRLSEIVGISIYWLWFGYFVTYKLIALPFHRLVFLLCTQALNLVWFWQIALTHYGMSTEEQCGEESFVKRQCRTCNNISTPKWMDWFWGGFHFQLTHHLFPRMPRSRLRKVSGIVKEFCEKNNLDYHEETPFEANWQVHKVLWHVSRQVKFFAHEYGGAEVKV